jgi:serine/threonine-protein kinase
VTAPSGLSLDALRDRYAVLRELGHGGMARVYLARDLKHDRLVAIKVLRPELVRAQGPERFLREIQLAARLQHPHILGLIDSGTIEAQPGISDPYYVMPYVEGESLRQRLEREKQLPLPDALRIAREVALALDYAHRHGVVHRDIKPENILLSEGQARVADFGVAKALATGGEQLTETGLAVGTPRYMSPEQATGGEVDARTDIYALGCVWYEMLSGAPPFSGRAPYALLAAHATEAPEPILKRRPSVPSHQATLLMRCLEKNPANRPASAAALSAELTERTEVARRQSWKTVASGVIVLLVGLAILFRPRSSGAKALDPNLVAVVPFRIAGADPALAYMREGMLDLLAATLTGDGGPRAADPRSVMSVWRRLVGDERRDLPQDSAMLLARQLGAGRLLLGGIVGTGEQLVISASLLQVPGGSARAAVSVTGRADSLGVMIDRLTSELLAREAGEAVQRVPELTSTSLPALRAYLQGQAAYRRGRYGQAVEWFDRALAQDSNFAPAALGLVSAETWEAPTGIDRALRIAFRLRDRLSARDRALLSAFAGPRYPEAYPFVDQFAGWERATEVLWDSPETWYQRGDVLFHRIPLTGAVWPLPRAAAAFRRAIELDSTFAAPLDHLVEIAVLTGDTAGVRRLGNLYLARYPESELSDFVRWRVATVLGDDSTRTQLRTTFARMNVRSLTRIIVFAQLSGIGMEDAEPAAAALRGTVGLRTADPEGGHWTLASLALNQGHPIQARDAVEAAREFSDPHQVLWNHILNWILEEGDSTAAVNAARRLLPAMTGALVRSPAARAELNTDVCVLGLWYIRQGGWEMVRRALRQIREPGIAGNVVPAWPPGEVCASVLEAAIAVNRKRADGRSALVRADSLVTLGWFAVAPLNLILAELWEAHGDLTRALAAVRRFEYDDPMGAAYLATRLRTEGRLASATGDRDAALRAYRHYLALVNRPESRIEPQVIQVRAELAALVGENPAQ